MEIYLTSSFATLVSINDTQISLQPTEMARITPDSQPTLMSVLPISETQLDFLLPYCVPIDKDNLSATDFCDCKRVDNRYYLHLSPKSLARTQLFTTITILGKKYILMQNAFDCSVTIRGDNFNTELDVGFAVKHFNYYTKTFANTNYIFLEFANDSESYLAWGKSMDKFVYASKLDSYEWQDNSLTMAERFAGELGQVKVSKYTLTNDVHLDYCEVGYLHSKPPKVVQSSLLPALFLEGVLAGNVEFVKTIVSPDFGENITAEMLTEFFPKFDSFVPSVKSARLIKKGHLVGILDFEVEQGKIVNIKSF